MSRQLKHVGLTMQMAIVCRKINHVKQMLAGDGNKGPVKDRIIKRVGAILLSYLRITISPLLAILRMKSSAKL